jgi:hypothetical protein
MRAWRRLAPDRATFTFIHQYSFTELFSSAGPGERGNMVDFLQSQKNVFV